MGPEPLGFVCRLAGIEGDEHVVSANEPIRYAGVPVGDHALLVKVRDAYGREAVASLEELPTLPFWPRP